MTNEVWVAIITGITTTLGVIATFIISLRNGHKTDVVAAKVEAVDAKAIEIHTLTNSNLSRVTAALEVANTKIDGLQKQVALMVGAKTIADKVITDSDSTQRDRRAGDAT